MKFELSTEYLGPLERLMSNYDPLYIKKFQPRNRKAKNVKPRKARKAIAAAVKHYLSLNERYWSK